MAAPKPASAVRGRPQPPKASTEKKTEPTAQKKPKRVISDEARAKAAQTRSHRAVFNAYLEKRTGSGSKRASNARDKIAAIDATLAAGTKERLVPKFVDGVRVGSEMKEVKLQMADRGRLFAQKQHLQSVLLLGNSGSWEKLRPRFLEILPSYAESQEWTGAMMIAFGVPREDVEEAGVEVNEEELAALLQA